MNKNDRELESKFYLLDKEKLEKCLIAIGAERVHERIFETNLRFDRLGGELERARQVLRLRQDSRIRLTYKGPSQLEDGVLNRQEIEFEVGDFEAGRRMLEALGFVVSVIYEKYRTTYALEGLEITIDELPYGDFCEIEGEVPEAIRGCAERLGLDRRAAITNSYLRLFNNLRKQMKLEFRDLTFENFQGVPVSAEELGVRPADRI
jgi:adenylate cyclase class 2